MLCGVAGARAANRSAGRSYARGAAAGRTSLSTLSTVLFVFAAAFTTRGRRSELRKQ